MSKQASVATPRLPALLWVLIALHCLWPVLGVLYTPTEKKLVASLIDLAAVYFAVMGGRTTRQVGSVVTVATGVVLALQIAQSDLADVPVLVLARAGVALATGLWLLALAVRKSPANG
jgi:hypothetical protein